MSTYEALRFFGLDYYATAFDIKAAYRRLATGLRPDAVIGDSESARVADERMQMLKRAYAALQNRVGDTPPDIDPLPGVEAVAEPDVPAAGLHTLTAGLLMRENWKLAAAWWRRLSFPQAEFSRVWRAAAVFVVMVTVGYGIVRAAAAMHFAPTVVDAKTVSAPKVEPVPRVTAARVTAAGKASPAHEKRSPVLTGAPRTLRAPVLPGVDPVEAKAIGSACLAETGDKEDAYRACVLRTAQETPHAIHLD
jgi:hypothetical protein